MKKIILFVCILVLAQFYVKAQWQPQPTTISTGRFAQFIDVVDANVVWGLVGDPAQAIPTQEFTRTIDGGQNWISGSINNAAGLSPASISAINADTAWVAMYGTTGAILRTNDGGLTWTKQATALFNAPGNFPDLVYFWDANNGVCMGDPTNGYFEIYTTTDGGINWVRTPDADIAAELTGEFGITDVQTTYGSNTIWFGTNLGRIYKSIDRGLHWTVATTPYAGSYIGAIAFRDVNNGIATNGSPGSAATDIIRTTDGGNTWTLVNTNTANMTVKIGACYVTGTDSTYFITNSAAATVNGSAFSIDDGNTWNSVDANIDADIEFANDTVGYMSSNTIDINNNLLMFKWVGPVVTHCAQFLDFLEATTNDSICAGDSIIYSIHGDFTEDPGFHLGINVNIYDENNNFLGAQTISDLTASGFILNFVPDPGQTTIGTVSFAIFFNLGATNEIAHFDINVFPTQCSGDSSNRVNNSVFHNVLSCAVITTQPDGCSVTLDLGNCPNTGLVNYDISYTVDGRAAVPGNTYNAAVSGGYNIIFSVDNGVCVKTFPASLVCTTGVDEISANDLFLIYPNPSTDVISISAKEASLQIGAAKIYDLTGRQVISSVFEKQQNTYTISINNLTKGIYFIEIYNTENKRITTSKFSKL